MWTGLSHFEARSEVLESRWVSPSRFSTSRGHGLSYWRTVWRRRFVAASGVATTMSVLQ